MPRRSGPTLYEVMNRSQAAGGSGPRNTGESQGNDSERPAASRLLTPGRVIRVPVGYVWTVCGGVVLLLALSYVFGYSRGRTVSDANAMRISQGLAEAIEEGTRIQDPLMDTTAVTSPARVIDTVLSVETSVEKPQRPQAITPRPRRPGSAVREIGKAYFVAETPLAGRAEEICDFIRDNGLDALLVETQNSRFRQVIVLPGFDPSDSEARSELQQRIVEIGRKFESQGRNNDNFDDTYYAVYRG